MKVKKLLAGVLAGTLVLGSLAVVSAAEITGDGWWGLGTTHESSDSVLLEDGSSVTFTIEVTEGDADGYAACLVELNDGSHWFTTTSDGDCWGDGEATTDTEVATMVEGGSYTVTMTRDGNDFTATYVDNETGELLFGELSLKGTVEFGKTYVYVTAEVGTFDVTVADVTGDEEPGDENGSDVGDGSGGEDPEEPGNGNNDPDVDNENPEVDIEETLVGDTESWWTSFPTSSKISLSMGSSVTFVINVLEGTTADDYAAFCVEISDASGNYFTTTSDGDCWIVLPENGVGESGDPDLNVATAVPGGSYTVTIEYAEDGNIYVTYVDNETGIQMFNTLATVVPLNWDEDIAVYVMAQVGTLTVTTTVPADDVVETPTADDENKVETTTDDENNKGEDDDNDDGAAAAVSGVKTADASLLLLIVLALAGCSAIAFVAKKRA